jgi:hypothetical protein
MSSNVEFSITAFDEASSVFEDVQSNAQECFSVVTSSASEAADSVEASGSEVQTSMEGVSSACSEAAESQSSLASTGVMLGDNQAFGAGGVQSNAMAMNTAALSAASLVMGINNVENAEVTLDRAHVTVEKDTNAVTSAQNAYNKAVLDYGSNSKEATDAAAKLKAAQDALGVAQERVDEAQRNLNSTIMMSSLQIIPGVIGAFTSLNTLVSSYPAIATAASGATDALSTAMDFLAANPIVLVITGIALLAVGLYEAYEHCAPFRDAINEIGSVLEGGVKTALTDVEEVLNFLWNDALKPLGEFIISVFVTYLDSFISTWDAVESAVNYLWKDVLVPVAEFFKGALAEAINFVMAPIDAFESAISKVSNLLKPITGLIGDLTGALKGLCFAHAAPAAEEFNNQVSKSIELSRGLTQNLDPLKQGLLGVSGSAAGGGGAGLGQQQNQTQQELILETKNLTNAISKLTTVSQRGVSSNQGIAVAMQRRF